MDPEYLADCIDDALENLNNAQTNLECVYTEAEPQNTQAEGNIGMVKGCIDELRELRLRYESTLLEIKWGCTFVEPKKRVG